MDADERDICFYLKGYLGQFVAAAEVARRAGGRRRFQQNPEWALPVLARLVEKGILESDSTGHFRLQPPQKEAKKKQRWVAPHIRRILEQSGRQFEEVHDVDDPETFLKQLEQQEGKKPS